MKKAVVVIPHSHTWFWTQTAVAKLAEFPPIADGVEAQVIVVDNSWDWSPAIRGITDTRLGEKVTVVQNQKSNKFHASALDHIVENFEFDYFMALETDVAVLRPNWLGWFIDQLKETDYAVGHWHHEQFVNPSCTLYAGAALRASLAANRANPKPNDLRWGPNFEKVELLTNRNPPRDYKDWNDPDISWAIGPFAGKHGWPEGTRLREKPSGQEKGPGWYEPGQQLHHWAVEAGYTYTICPTATTIDPRGMPTQTFYGSNPPAPQRNLEIHEMDAHGCAVHLWGGTRALDIVKHQVDDPFVRNNTPFWLQREARFWMHTVPTDIREQTLALIRQYGWHLRNIGAATILERDREAARYIQGIYEGAGVNFG